MGNHLTKIVEQLRACGYTCEAGDLENNTAFQELEQMAAKEDSYPYKDGPLREQLAALAHEQWSGWMRYMIGQGETAEIQRLDGTVENRWIMPEWAYLRWQRQMYTDYADLPETEKESDREEADRVLALINGQVDDGTHGQWTPVLLSINSAMSTMGVFSHPLDKSLEGLTWGEWQLEQARRILAAVQSHEPPLWSKMGYDEESIRQNSID